MGPVAQLAVAGGLSIGTAFVGNHLGQGLEVLGADAILNLGDALGEAGVTGLQHLLSEPLSVSSATYPMIGTLLGFIIPWCGYLALQKTMGEGQRIGEEHGSATWADKREMRLFATSKNPDPDNVLLLSKNYGLAVSRQGFDQVHDRNLNVIVLGGSGAGKTRYFVKPNICQMFGNYLITDPKYTLPRETLQLLIDNGYQFAIFNTNTTSDSVIYNPFHYVRTDLDVLEFVDGFLSMTKDQQKTGGDQFWDDSANLLLTALIGYMRDYLPEEDYHFGSLLTLLDMAQVKENDENFESPLDRLFKEIETGYHEDADHFESPRRNAPATARLAVAPSARQQPRGTASTMYSRTTGLCPGDLRRRPDGKKSRGLTEAEDFPLAQYHKFKSAAGKTLKSILISVNVKMKAIATREVRQLLCGPDQMHLDWLGDENRKYVIFDSFKDTNQQTLGFLHGLLVWQTLNVLCKKADSTTGKLKKPVQLILDEFKSLNLPKSIADMISVVRSRNIGMCIILQSMEQLYQMYDEHCANGIVGCCDTVLMLGGGDNATNKQVSDMVGQQTVRQTTNSVSHQGLMGGSWSENQQTVARALIDPAEVGRLGRDECIVYIKGTKPAIDKKYPLERHKRYPKVDPGHSPVDFWQTPIHHDKFAKEGERTLVVRPIHQKVRAEYEEGPDLAGFFEERRAELRKEEPEAEWHPHGRSRRRRDPDPEKQASLPA